MLVCVILVFEHGRESLRILRWELSVLLSGVIAPWRSPSPDPNMQPMTSADSSQSPFTIQYHNTMKTHLTNRILLTSALAASIFLWTGCDGSRTSDYPDNSVNTTRRVDDIKQNARDQKDAVDAQYDRASNQHDFEERQIREKYKASRQSLVNEAESGATSSDAKLREFQIQAKHDKDVIAAELAEALRTNPPEKAAELQADAAARTAEVDNTLTGKTAPHTSDIERSKAKYIQRGIELDRDESKEISALESKRSKSRNVAQAEKLKIDTWTTDELAKVGKDSAKATKQP